MRITVERYVVTNPAWRKPSERFKVLSKRFCCDAMRQIERHLKIDGRGTRPSKLIFWPDGEREDGSSENFDMNFCPGCGEKVEFVEQDAERSGI